MKLVQINTIDTHGGAASVASTLHHFFRDRGHESTFFVGTKLGDDPDTIELGVALKDGNERLPWLQKGGRAALRRLDRFRHRQEMRRGLELLGPAETAYLEEVFPYEPDLILCHNLHGGYFDLRALPRLSRRYPVVLMLHDPWLLAGHCAHSFDCEKWVDGCHGCPYLEVQYALKRDTAHDNWARKLKIYQSCRLHLLTPSQWLMDKVERSILKRSVVTSRVINNGVDQTIFRPADKEMVRAGLGIGSTDSVVVFAANGIRESIWKDYATMRAAVARAADAMPDRTLKFIAVGEDAPSERIGAATITFVPYQSAAALAPYYQAADLYLHAARAENFPSTIVEALSCGTPVVATAVGGVPEQVRGMKYLGDASGLNHYGCDAATGILTPVGDVAALSDALCVLLQDPEIRRRLSFSAAADASQRFSLQHIGGQYLDFFEETIDAWKSGAGDGYGK